MVRTSGPNAGSHEEEQTKEGNELNRYGVGFKIHKKKKKILCEFIVRVLVQTFRCENALNLDVT